MSDLKRKIVLDCDGVLLDWNASFREWMKRHEFHERSEKWYSVSKRYGIEKATASQLIRQHNESAAIAFLGPYKDALIGLYALSAMGYSFDIVTALSDYEPSQKLRELNLKEVFPLVEFDRIFYTDTGGDKRDILKEHYGNSGCFWIEDKVENAIIGMEIGLRSLILRNPHHETEVIPAEIPCFDTWNDIVDHITQKDLY